MRGGRLPRTRVRVTNPKTQAVQRIGLRSGASSISRLTDEGGRTAAFGKDGISGLMHDNNHYRASMEIRQTPLLLPRYGYNILF